MAFKNNSLFNQTKIGKNNAQKTTNFHLIKTH